MANGLRKAATVGMPTSHGVPIIPDPTSVVSTPDGRGLVRVGPLHIGPHTFGNDFHAPNSITPGSGSKFVVSDGLPIAFVGDSFL